MPKITKSKITKCTVCGGPIEYKTKKPTKCKGCIAAGQAPVKYRPHKTKWAKESEMFKILKELLPDAETIINGYYSWLLSPKEEPLQLDWYCPEFKIGAEYNGAQHYSFNKYFHKTKKRFEYQKLCDSTKADLCCKKGVTLLEIRFDEKLSPLLIASKLYRKDPSLFNILIQTNRLKLSPDDLKKVKGG